MYSPARMESGASSVAGVLGRLALRLMLAALIGRTAAGENSDSTVEAMHLLRANCLSCHGAEKRKGGLDMESREALLRGGDTGLVVASEPGESLLLRVLEPDADPHMPPKKQLTERQIGTIRAWLEAGTPWDEAALREGAESREVVLGSLPAGYEPVLALALSPDGERLAVGRGGRIVVHDVGATNFPVEAEVTAHLDAVRALAWSPDGEWLASGSWREVKMWRRGLELAWSRTNLTGRVTAARFSPFGGALLVAEGAAAESGWVRLFSTEKGAPLAEWQAHEDTIYDLAVSPDGGLLATAGNEGVVKLWELVSRREVGQFEGHAGAVFGAAFNTNASELVTVSPDRELRVWDVRTRQSVVTIGPENPGFNAVSWSGDGTAVIAGTDDGRLIRFTEFKRHSGAQSSATARERELGKWEEPVLSVAVNHEADRFYAGTQDGKVYAVDGEGKLLATLEGTAPAPILAESSTPSFLRDVLPVMAKAGCMAGSCHAKPEGQNGFALSVFSYDPEADYAEIVKEGRGRRVFPAAPAESLLLLKPTMAVEHGGGERITPGSDAYHVIEKWIATGMVYQHPGEPTLARIRVSPREGIYERGSARQLRVEAEYSDGSARDVTALADYVSNDTELAKVGEEGEVRVGNLSGEGVVVARYLGFVDAARITVPAETRLPDEKYAALPVNNFIDRLAYEHFQKLGLYPSEGCTDEEFIRRSSLDAIGILPKPEEVRSFLLDETPGKRKRWVEHLLAHPLYGDYWANKWADLLRPNPDRVGVKSIYTLDQWLRDSFRENKPYDQFVREILTAEGSNHRHGPAVVYRDRREPPELTTMFTQLFLGVRMECAKCHHHPNEKWSQDDFYQFAAFFGPVKQKGAGLSPPISAGTETFFFRPGGTVKHPVTGEVMKPRPLDGPVVETETDPRRELSEWVVDPENPFFAKAAVNRVWAVFFGRGFVEPVDDFRISNPASNEPLLEALASDFAAHGYDFKHLIRAILNSHLYQLSSTPNEYNLADTKNYSRSYRRRLAAEVLLDAVDDVTGVRDQYEGSPPGTRAIQTWSYKVDSHFMDAFGRPNSSSDCPCERDLQTSVVQALHMMNSRDLQRKLSSDEGRVKQLVESEQTNRELVTELYLAALSRFPTEGEIAVATEAFEASGVSRQQAAEDVLWALLNSAEFVFNH